MINYTQEHYELMHNDQGKVRHATSESFEDFLTVTVDRPVEEARRSRSGLPSTSLAARRCGARIMRERAAA